MRLHFASLVVLGVLAAVANLVAGQNQKEFEAAKAEYEQATPQDEATRSTYVNKLAQIIERNVAERWKTGRPNDEFVEIAEALNGELRKHPVPKNSDPKKLSALLVGHWQSPRHTYIFRRDGKYGVEDGTMDTSWRIQGNQIVFPNERNTILVLNKNYLIYAAKDAVFWHTRVTE